MQFTGGGHGGGNNNLDMIQGAMKAYKMFSGDQGGEGGGNFFDNISTTEWAFEADDGE